MISLANRMEKRAQDVSLLEMHVCVCVEPLLCRLWSWADQCQVSPRGRLHVAPALAKSDPPALLDVLVEVAARARPAKVEEIERRTPTHRGQETINRAEFNTESTAGHLMIYSG